MENANIYVVGGAIIFLVLLWAAFGFRHLKYLRLSLNEQWERIVSKLRKRCDLLPNLIETVRVYESGRDFSRIISEREKAIEEVLPGAKKIEVEHDLSSSLKELLRLDGDVFKDTNYLELKREFRDLGEDLSNETRIYNRKVRKYNRVRKSPLWVLLALLSQKKQASIFEVEV